MAVTTAELVGGSISTVMMLPVGFLIGWRAGWKEHEVRARADRAAGMCSECLRPLDRHENDT